MQAFMKFFVALTVTFLGFFAQAEDLKSHVQTLNAEPEIADAVVVLKDIFRTTEDHRQIDLLAKDLKKSAAKSVWRFEVDGDKVAFRFNGKVQFHISEVNPETNSFLLNGRAVYFKPGKSFKAANLEVQNILKAKTTAGLQTLFIQEAHAGWFLPLLGLFAFVGGASAAEASMPPGLRCVRSVSVTSPVDHRRNPFYQRASQLSGGFKGARCNGMPTNMDQRLRLVANNYKPNGRFRSDYANNQCVHLAGNEAEYLICQCIRRKTNANCDIGWNMTPEMANATCRLGFDMYNACMRVTEPTPVPVPTPVPTPAPPSYDPVTPCTRDKNGQYYGSCGGDPVTPPLDADKPNQGAGTRD